MIRRTQNLHPPLTTLVRVLDRLPCCVVLCCGRTTETAINPSGEPTMVPYLRRTQRMLSIALEWYNGPYWVTTDLD